MLRNMTAYLISPVMKVTGFRFSTDYRWGTTRFHRAVYAVCNTVTANYAAGMTLWVDGDKIIYKK